MKKTIYLDQNKWIDLARAAGNPHAFPRHYQLLLELTEKDAEGSVQLPVTFGNIYETYKTGDPRRRFHVAAVMSNLSWGVVFRSRKRRLNEELLSFFAKQTDALTQQTEPNWFVSNNFLEAVADIDRSGGPLDVPREALSFIAQAPHEALLGYLTHSLNSDRLAAVMNQSASLASLLAAIEGRRERWRTESMAMRKRAHGALLFLEDQETIVSTASTFGILPHNFSENNGSLARELMTSVPTFDVERELTLRLESQGQAITENDLRDMANFVAAIPYADVIVGEKPFVNLALQAGLHTKYKTTLLTNLDELEACL